MANRNAVYDAVMEAAEARGMGRDNADREGLAWRAQAIYERNAIKGGRRLRSRRPSRR